MYQGRNTFYDKALVDIHFAELIAEVDMNDYYTIDQIMEKFSMSHAAVLSFVQRNDIPRITQGRKVYYSRAHIDTFKGERENVDPLYYTYKDIHEKYKLSKDQINYYVHNYNIPNHKQGRLTIVERNSFDRIIKERMNTSFLDKEVEKRKNRRRPIRFLTAISQSNRLLNNMVLQRKLPRRKPVKGNWKSYSSNIETTLMQMP